MCWCVITKNTIFKAKFWTVDVAGVRNDLPNFKKSFFPDCFWIFQSCEKNKSGLIGLHPANPIDVHKFFIDCSQHFPNKDFINIFRLISNSWSEDNFLLEYEHFWTVHEISQEKDGKIFVHPTIPWRWDRINLPDEKIWFFAILLLSFSSIKVAGSPQWTVLWINFLLNKY